MRICIVFFISFLFSLLLPSMANGVGECDALLQFSNSFTISQDASIDYCDYYSSISYPKTDLWRNETDCCSWDGVMCDMATNRVIGLNLSCSWLQGPLHSNNILFSLSNLRHLDLAGNDFTGSQLSRRFGVFTAMEHLNLSTSGFSGSIPLEMISHLSNLTTLDLSCHPDSELSIDDHTFRWLVQNLTRLRELVLDYVDMSKILHVSLTNLSSTMTSLSLHGCDLRGTLPVDIFHLPNLRSLSLSGNYALTGTLPPANWTCPLVHLDLSSTNFHGSIPASVGNLTSMNYLDLSNSGFAGSIPSTLGYLYHLTHLELGQNNLSDTVDIEMFARLKNLQWLSLGGNNLTVLLQSDGNCSFPRLKLLLLSHCNLTQFPYFLRFASELERLDLSRNKISGQIPEWFWRIGKDTMQSLNLLSNKITGPLPIPPPSTKEFDASSNNFTGEIPPSICRLSSVGRLCLADNRLNGTLPGCLGNLSSLTMLLLNHNLLQGPLPRSLANCTALEAVDVSKNEIQDTFPSWLINANNGLYSLGLQSNQFHGVIEDPLPPKLSSFSISNNNFSGQLPTNFLRNSSVDSIDMANNSFEGPLPIPPSFVAYYLLSKNMFHGGIPHQICSTTGLKIINLSGNRLTGTIPQCFINISASLTVLDLGENMFSGKMLEIFVPMTKLQTIRLSQNQLRGTLPQSLIHCKDLKILDLSENELEGRFPYWLDTLPNLQVLVLRSNKLYGPVDGSSRNGHPFPKLHIFDLSKNSFLGPLPAKYLASLIDMKNEEKGGLHYMGEQNIPNSYYQDSIEVFMKGRKFKLVKILTVFMSIDFSNNSFEGEIPEVIGDLKAIKGVNFSHNNLSGIIPASVGHLTNLEWFDLSSNKLNGTIPRGLAAIPWLAYLNLSNNQLTGPIPQSTQFDTFNYSSFDENPGLCGHPLQKLCRNDRGETAPSTSHEEEEMESSNWIEWRAVLMGYGCGLILGISIGYIVLETRRPRWLARMVEQKRSRKTRRPN